MQLIKNTLKLWETGFCTIAKNRFFMPSTRGQSSFFCTRVDWYMESSNGVEHDWTLVATHTCGCFGGGGAAYCWYKRRRRIQMVICWLVRSCSAIRKFCAFLIKEQLKVQSTAGTENWSGVHWLLCSTLHQGEPLLTSMLAIQQVNVLRPFWQKLL